MRYLTPNPRALDQVAAIGRHVERHYRYGPSPRVGLDRSQKSPSRQAGRIEIKQHELEQRQQAAAPVTEKGLQRLVRVANDGQVIGDFRPQKGTPGQVGIRGAVFHEQDFPRRRHFPALASPLPAPAGGEKAKSVPTVSSRA